MTGIRTKLRNIFPLLLCAVLLGTAAYGETALVSFVGDCSTGDAYQFVDFAMSYHATLAEKGLEWPFSLVKDYFLSDDLTVANLEVALTTSRNHKEKKHPLRGKPEFADIYRLAGIEAVNTVNNHCEDFGVAGYKDTLAALDAAGVMYFGTNRPKASTGYDHVLITEAGGIRFGFVGAVYPKDKDYEWITEKVRRLKEEERCDVVVASLHWGTEEQFVPDASQGKWAKKVIDAGADVIYGHHPHVLQPILF